MFDLIIEPGACVTKIRRRDSEDYVAIGIFYIRFYKLGQFNVARQRVLQQPRDSFTIKEMIDLHNFLESNLV